MIDTILLNVGSNFIQTFSYAPSIFVIEAELENELDCFLVIIELEGCFYQLLNFLFYYSIVYASSVCKERNHNVGLVVPEVVLLRDKELK